MKPDLLYEMGFFLAAECHCSSIGANGFALLMKPDVSSYQKVVYAVVVDNDVKYVGQTDRGLKRRFDAYRNRSVTSPITDRYVGKSIGKAIKKGSRVEILLWVDKEQLTLGRFTVNRFLSVEYAILKEKKWDLPWHDKYQRRSDEGEERDELLRQRGIDPNS